MQLTLMVVEVIRNECLLSVIVQLLLKFWSTVPTKLAC